MMLNSHVERITTEEVVLADSDGTTTLRNDYVFVDRRRTARRVSSEDRRRYRGEGDRGLEPCFFVKAAAKSISLESAAFQDEFRRLLRLCAREDRPARLSLFKGGGFQEDRHSDPLSKPEVR